MKNTEVIHKDLIQKLMLIRKCPLTQEALRRKMIAIITLVWLDHLSNPIICQLKYFKPVLADLKKAVLMHPVCYGSGARTSELKR